MRLSALLSAAVLFAFSFHAHANGFEHWSKATILLTNDFYGVAYGADTFVAVASEGKVLFSADGAAWANADSATTQDLHAVTYGQGTFVAVGSGGTIVTSPNGAHWTARASEAVGEFLGIVYGGGQFVAVGRDDTGNGYGNLIMTSPNGVDWTAHYTGVQRPLAAVAYGLDQYVAVGQLTAMASSNGLEWHEIRPPNYGAPFGIAFGNHRFIAAALDVYTPGFPFSVSLDAETWRNTSANIDGEGRALTFASGVFVGVGGLRAFDDPTNHAAVSADGIVWSTYPVGEASELLAITYGRETFVTVGVGGAIFQSGRVVQPALDIHDLAGQHAVEVTIHGDTDSAYVLQSSATAAPESWTDLMAVTNSEEPIHLSNPESGSATTRFFRLLMH